MESKNPRLNLNQQAALKVLELLSTSLNPKPSSSPGCNFQIPSDPNESLQRDLSKFTSSSSPQQFSVFIIQCIEGCYPILKQKWHFKYNPISTNTTPDPVSYAQISVILRSLAVFLSVSLNTKGAKFSIEIKPSSAKFVDWDTSLKASDILKHPNQAIEIKNRAGSLSLQIEHTSIYVKPKITEQNLGSRPRLVSFDIGEDFKEVNRSFSSHFSTETSPQDAKNKKGNILSLIASESFYEEKEIGFNLISSGLLNEKDSDEENYGHNSFDLNFEKIDIENNDDAKISLYIQQCSNILNLKLFDLVVDIGTQMETWKRSNM